MTSRTDRPTLPALLCVGALIWTSGCGSRSPEDVETETAVAVRTAPAVRGDIRGVVHATGTVEPAPGADLVVVAPEPARIAAIPPATGDRVRKGDLLVRFEIPGTAADVERQQAEVSRADANLKNARAAETRAQELFDRGVAARKEVEDANRAEAEAEAALAQAHASLTAARTVAGRSTVRATFDGIVAKRYHTPDDLVEASAGDPVLRVIDPRRLEVAAAVPLSDVARIEVGAPAHVSSSPIDTGDLALTVVSLPAAVESGTPTVPVRLAFRGGPRLPVGTPVQVTVEAEQHRGVVLVPAPAVVHEGDETAVYVAKDGKAERRSVKVGISNEARAEIVSGIGAGDMVIVDGQAGLPDDAAITVRSGGETASPPASAAEDKDRP